MDFGQLEVLVAVVEEQNFTRAARRLFRTQPAVSMALRSLEEEIGLRLIERSCHRKCAVTATGQFFYAYASRILLLRSEMLSLATRQIAKAPEELCNCSRMEKPEKGKTDGA